MTRELPLQRRPGPRPHPPPARRLLLAAARRPRRRRGQGRGHRDGRLRPLGAALLRRRRRSRRSAPARRSTCRSTAASARSGSTSSPTRGREALPAPGRGLRRRARELPPRRPRPARGRLRARCARRNPRLVYCAITGYGQTGPNVARAGHDMNYLGLDGLLGPDRRAPTAGRSSRPARSPTSAAAALMAAFGILAALRERERSGEGQLVDVSMTDGALSWLAMVAGAYLCDGRVPQRGDELAQRRRSSATCPTRPPTAGSAAARSSRSSGRRFCDGAGRPDLLEQQFDAPGSRGLAADRRGLPAEDEGRVDGVQRRARRMIEPVLDLDEALDSELVREREMVVEVEQPRARARCACSARRSSSRARPADPTRPAPALGEHTEEVLARGRLRRRGDRRAARVRRRGRAPRTPTPSSEVHGMSLATRPPGAKRRLLQDLRARRARRTCRWRRSATTCARACCPSR